MKLADMVAITGTVSGTGNVTIGAAVDGFRGITAAGYANGEALPYRIEVGETWEVGVATLGFDIEAGWYLTRNPYSAVSFPVASTCTVYLTIPSFAHVVAGLGVVTKNAATVGSSGVAGGGGANAGGRGAVAFGEDAIAAADFSLAIGEGSFAYAVGAAAIGRYARSAECAALVRPADASRSGTYRWEGVGSGSAPALDMGGKGFIIPDVRCSAAVEILLSASTTSMSDRFSAKAYVSLQRTGGENTMQLLGTPVVQVIHPDTAATGAVTLSVVGTGSDSYLSIKPGRTDCDFIASVTAAVRFHEFA